METYKLKLKQQNILWAAGALIMGAFAILAFGNELGWFSVLRPLPGDGHWHSTWNGFMAGASCGLFALMVAHLGRNLRAMKDEKKLKKLYVKTHDERSTQIIILARNTAMQILLWLGLMGTVIAGYFSITVSITILSCTFVSSILSLLLTGYYSKKM